WRAGSRTWAAGSTFGQVVMGAQGLPVKTIAALADNAATQGLVLSPRRQTRLSPRVRRTAPGANPGHVPHPDPDQDGRDLRLRHEQNHFRQHEPIEGVVAASKGDIDGLLSWEPNLSRLVETGGSLYATGTTVYVTGAPQPQRLIYNNALLMASQSFI